MAYHKGFLLLAALAALSLCTGYVYDRDYRYRYRGFLHAGFPNRKSQLVGSSIDAEVYLQPHQRYHIMKIESPKIDRLNRETDNFQEEEFNYRQDDVMAEHLGKPIKVFFERGEIHHFLAARDDPEWSVNIKKAMLSMFTLNLEQNNVVRIVEDDYLVRPATDEHYFRVMEKDIGGNCESLYIIDHSPYEGSNVESHVLNITKTRNYHNCDHKPYKMYLTYRGDQCVDCEDEKAHPLHSNSHYYYEVRGNRFNYVIERVTNEGELVYAPFTTESQTVEVFHNHTLHLIEELETRREIVLSSDTVPYYSLEYIYPDHHGFSELVDLKKPHFLHSIYGYSADVQEVERMMRDIVADYDDEKYGDKFHTHNITAKFLEVVKAFSTLSYDDIDEVYKKIGETEEPMKNLFVDVLASVGTNPAFLYGKYLIQSRRLSVYHTLYFIETIHKHIKEPSEILLDEFFRLCDHSYVKEVTKIQTICHLALASLVHETCVARDDRHHHATEDKSQCDVHKAAKYYQYVARHFHDEEDEYHHVAHIKTAGNFGIKEILEYLKPYIEEEENSYLRVSAIFSLRKVAHHHPDLVYSILMPIYFNHTEDYEVRIAAFTVLISSDLPLSHVETLAFSLWDEPSTQVQSFVYSTLHYLANSTHPCHKSIARHVTQVFTTLDQWDKDYSHLDKEYAFQFLTSGYDEEHDLGGYTQFAYIPSNSSYVPRAMYLGLNDYVVGTSFDSFAIGYHGHGLDRYLDRLFGPNGLWNHPGQDWTITPREEWNHDVNKDLKDADKKLKITPRQYEPVRGNLFFKYLNNEMCFLHFNETTIDRFFKHGVKNMFNKINDLGEFRHRRHALKLDKTMVIFSEIGLPILLEVKLPLYTQIINHELKLELTPADTPLVEHAKLHMDTHVAYDRNFFMNLGIVVPYHHLYYGAGVNRRSVVSLPTKMDFDVDLKETKMSVKWTPIRHHVFHTHSEPYTFVDKQDNYKPLIHEETYVPFVLHPWTNRDQEYFHDALGVGVRVDAHLPHTWNSGGDWYRFLTEKNFREKYYYYMKNPHMRQYSFDLYLTPANRDMTNEVELVLDYEHYSPRDNKVYTPKFDEGFEELGRGAERKWENHVVKAELHARGQRERTIKAEMSISRSQDSLYHKWNLYYDRTPFTSQESEHFKVCWSSYHKFPKYDFAKLFKLETEELDHTVHSTNKIHFGRDCSTDNKVSINGVLERSEYQKKREAQRETPLTINYWNTYGYYYQKCMELRNKGIMYSPYCRDYINHVTKLHNETWTVEYENIKPWAWNVSYKIRDMIRHWGYPYRDVDYLATNEPNKMTLRMEAFVEHKGYGNVDIYEPHTTIRYDHLPMSELNLIPISTSPLFDYSNWDEYTTHYEKPFCLVHGDHVRTFDNVSYTLPEIGCYKVLAKDCSLNNHFTIMGAKTTENANYKKALKIFFGKHKFEAIPTAEGITLREDGAKIPISETEPYHHEEDGQEIFYVNYNGFYYTFHSHLYGIEVYYDGNAIYIRPSFYYRGKVCGLCGDYDGDEQDEFKGPEGCSYNDTEAFSYRYAVPDASCEVPKVHNACDNHRTGHCAILRNHHIEVGTRNKQTCFTVAPVTRCADGCRPTRLISRSIGFHCLPSKDEFTRSLVRASKVRVLNEIRRKSKDHFAEIEFSESCIPNEH